MKKPSRSLTSEISLFHRPSNVDAPEAAIRRTQRDTGQEGHLQIGLQGVGTTAWPHHAVSDGWSTHASPLREARPKLKLQPRELTRGSARHPKRHPRPPPTRGPSSGHPIGRTVTRNHEQAIHDSCSVPQGGPPTEQERAEAEWSTAAVERGTW